MAVYSQRNLALARFGGNTADTLLAAHTRRHFVSQISTANTRSFVSVASLLCIYIRNVVKMENKLLLFVLMVNSNINSFMEPDFCV